MPTAKVELGAFDLDGLRLQVLAHELGVINETFEEVWAPLSAGRHGADWWGNPFARRP